MLVVCRVVTRMARLDSVPGTPFAFALLLQLLCRDKIANDCAPFFAFKLGCKHDTVKRGGDEVGRELCANLAFVSVRFERLTLYSFSFHMARRVHQKIFYLLR